MRCAALGALVTLALGASTALAAATSVPVRLEYAAPAECPSREAVLAIMTRELPDLVFAAEGSPARVVVLRVDPKGEGLVGSVWFVGVDGSTSFREVSGTSCAELTAALALMAALALDAPAPSPVSPTPTPALPPPPLPPPAPPPASAPTWTLGVGARAVAESAIAPELAWGGELVAEVRSTRPTGLSPLLSLALLGAAAPTAQTSAGAADFSLVTPRLGLAPVVVGTPLLTLRPVLGLDVGALFASGEAAARSFSVTRPWVTPRLGALLERAVAERWRVVAEVNVAFPLSRDVFRFEKPEVLIHEVPGVSWAFALGVGFDATTLR